MRYLNTRRALIHKTKMTRGLELCVYHEALMTRWTTCRKREDSEKMRASCSGELFAVDSLHIMQGSVFVVRGNQIIWPFNRGVHRLQYRFYTNWLCRETGGEMIV